MDTFKVRMTSNPEEETIQAFLTANPKRRLEIEKFLEARPDTRRRHYGTPLKTEMKSGRGMIFDFAKSKPKIWQEIRGWDTKRKKK
jgi:hypothetical protein